MPTTTQPTSEVPPRVRLLRAAEALFYGRGIRATGVEAVLEHAQVARNTLYHQFGGKDGLVAAYLQDRDDRWRQHWEAAIDACEDPLDRILAIFDALSTWDRDVVPLTRGCAFLDAQVELSDPQHPAGEVIAAHWRHLAHRLEELAGDAGLPSGAEVARDLVLLYRGALSSLSDAPAEDVIAHARGVAADLLVGRGAHAR
ncbi:TetR/AcrR family transcriptional regulator [Nitriliruptor alkaliphilus]|uniref:TetR/AcrR family transcriptional regulator n=1 Tax=Nitriliruptor alkaliphilus TaxID=427918 RepID=UPI00069843D9|nr:helix-turn-helix domain-containing protein [Nitriliruptor alkaliphilus]